MAVNDDDDDDEEESGTGDDDDEIQGIQKTWVYLYTNKILTKKLFS